MKSVSHIKCPNCGEFNTDRDNCETCDALISHKKKEETRATKVKEKEMAIAIEQFEKLNLADRLRKHPFFLVKILGWALQSVWIVLNIIGGLIAWFVAMVAAG